MGIASIETDLRNQIAELKTRIAKLQGEIEKLHDEFTKQEEHLDQVEDEKAAAYLLAKTHKNERDQAACVTARIMLGTFDVLENALDANEWLQDLMQQIADRSDKDEDNGGDAKDKCSCKSCCCDGAHSDEAGECVETDPT